MHDAYTPIVFQRHNLFLRTVMIDNQPWLVAIDFARLIGVLRPNRMPRLVDPHQRRAVVLRHASGGSEEVIAISEAGAYRLLYRFAHPEHRCISRWLSEEVVPALYDRHRDAPEGPYELGQSADRHSEMAGGYLDRPAGSAGLPRQPGRPGTQR